MLTLEDCIEMSDLTEEEVLAIAEHEHIPAIAAAAMAHYLVHRPDGEMCVKAMIKDDIRDALARGDKVHALTLKLVMRHFIGMHPRCEQRLRALMHTPERRQGGRAGKC
ncbi:MAG: hypothetical protein A3H35_14680 [Betaproteobacteria bacterium RIFCSPLOWO2_02_FULL_62_17]|nr:MAG: hypothetical protein A3H35_14680 [Betaproteobacteria bacterium RIFCSPLOWO2_02_FULL_62_17]